MAEETIDMAVKAGLPEKRKCDTAGIRLTAPLDSDDDRLQVYGEGSAEIKQMIAEDAGLGDKLDPQLPYSSAEIIWICRNEMPVNIEDILARRTRALLLNARASERIAPVVAQIMADENGYGKEWQNNQVASYYQLIQNYL